MYANQIHASTIIVKIATIFSDDFTMLISS